MASNKYREAHPEWFDEKGRPHVWVLRELIDYNPETGSMTWKERGPKWFLGTDTRTAGHLSSLFNSKLAGKEAMKSSSGKGHRQGYILGKMTSASQVAFALGSGRYPEKSAALSNNNGGMALSNIIDQSAAKSSAYSRILPKKSSLYFGVYKNSRDNLWVSIVSVDGNRKFLGSFATEDAAASAYNEYVIRNMSSIEWLNDVPDGHKERELSARKDREAAKYSNGSSRYRGVSFVRRRGKWLSYIFVRGRRIDLGYFQTEMEAAMAYDKSARKHFGKSAFQNNANYAATFTIPESIDTTQKPSEDF